MLLLNNKSLFEKCRMLRDHGRGPKTKDLFNDIFAFKYMPFNLQAALGYSQFLRIKFLLKKKREIFEIYKSKLKNNKNIQLNLDNKFIKNGCWAVAITVKNAKRNTIKLINRALIKKKYMPRPFFYPISMLPAYRRKYNNYIYYKKNNLNAYNLAKKSLVLPSSYLLKKNDIINITKIIKIICLKNNL
jgi:perosamine synthetase